MFCGTDAGETRALTGSGGTEGDVICSWPTCFLHQGPMDFYGDHLLELGAGTKQLVRYGWLGGNHLWD